MTPQEFADANGIEYAALFVPFSQSRNRAEKNPSLNWRVTLTKGRASLSTDYMQGCGHLPHYSHRYADRLIYDAAVREACETGKSALIPWATSHFGISPHVRKKIEPPALADVLGCLVRDASALNYSNFEDWAADCGYDVDSRKAEATYRECLATALKLRQIVDLDAAAAAFREW